MFKTFYFRLIKADAREAAEVVIDVVYGSRLVLLSVVERLRIQMSRLVQR